MKPKIIYHDIPQHILNDDGILVANPKWLALRIGKMTASAFTTVANGTAKGIETLCQDKAFEVERGRSRKQVYQNAAMARGNELEVEAVLEYSRQEMSIVKHTGFVQYGDMFGFSPDGLPGDGGLEVKCPEDFTHHIYIKQYRASEDWTWIPTGYQWQVQSSLYMSGREWWDFCSYHPDYEGDEKLIIQRVLPDDKCFEKIKKGMAFCEKRIKEIVRESNANV